MSTRPHAFMAFSALVASTLLLGLAGCSSAETTPAPTPDCSGTPEFSKDTPTVAVLGELGALEGYDADIKTVITGAENVSARILVNGVAGTDAPTHFADTLMIGDGGNKLERDRNLRCKKDLVDNAITALNSAEKTILIDNFTALTALEGNLAGAPDGAPVDVVVFSSMQNNATPVDLTDPAQLADPETALNILAQNGMIPDCTGWRIYGINSNNGAVANTQLREFWRLYAERCGGALVAWTTHLSTFPIADAVNAANFDLVAVNEDKSGITASIEGDLVFAAGSDVLLDDDASRLELLRLIEISTGDLTITGHTDVGGTESDNIDLSTRRAEALAAWLTDNGVIPSRIRSIDGVGSSQAIYPSPLDEQQRQANRRVVITIQES